MTCKELIEKLKKMPQDAKVVVYNDEGWDEDTHYDKNFDVFADTIGRYSIGGEYTVVVFK